MHVDVLIVEDEVDLATATAEYLTAQQISCHHVRDGESALAFAHSHDLGLVLLDVNLPGESGFSCCRALRRYSDIPVIFISARSDDDDQVLGLNLGGDDYVVKPFSLAVLAAKVHRILNRTTPAAGFDDGHIRVDDVSGRTWLDGEETMLPTMEDRLLRYFVRNRGRVVTKQELFDEVWGEPFTSDGTLSVHIRRLRLRIEPDPDSPRYIRTVWGRGYLFEDPQ